MGYLITVSRNQTWWWSWWTWTWTLSLNSRCFILFPLNNNKGMHDIVGWVWVTTHTEHGEVTCKCPSSECDRDFRPQNMTQHSYNTGIVSQSIVQWSSPAGMMHIYRLYAWMRCTLAAHHVPCRAHGTWCSLHWDGMDRWAVVFNMW